jgi:hypothetical protein
MDESEPSLDAERKDWHAFSKAGLARAYSDAEPDYPASLVRNQGNTQGIRITARLDCCSELDSVKGIAVGLAWQ